MDWQNSQNSRINDRLAPVIACKLPVKIIGTISGFPQIRIRNTASSTRCRSKYILNLSSINDVPYPHIKILLYLYNNNTDSFPHCGDTICCITNLSHPTNYPLNRFLTYRKYLSFRNILFVAKCSGKTAFNAEHSSRVWGWISSLRQQMLSHLEYGIQDTEQSELLGSIILGKQPDINRQILNHLAVLGSIHILVISGLHVGALAFITCMLLQLAGLRRKTAMIGMFGVILFYLFLVGLRISILRSIIMITVYFLADLLNRERNAMQAILCAGLIQLLFLPKLIFDNGFEYSFLAVLGIIVFYPLCRKTCGSIFRYGVIRLLSITCIVWIVISPLTAVRCGLFLPIGILISAIYAGLTYCVMIIGMVSVITGFFSPWIAEVFNFGNFVLLKWMVFTTNAVYGLRAGHFYFANLPTWSLVSYYCGIVILLLTPLTERWKMMCIAVNYLSIIGYGLYYAG